MGKVTTVSLRVPIMLLSVATALLKLLALMLSSPTMSPSTDMDLTATRLHVVLPTSVSDLDLPQRLRLKNLKRLLLRKRPKKRLKRRSKLKKRPKKSRRRKRKKLRKKRLRRKPKKKKRRKRLRKKKRRRKRKSRRLLLSRRLSPLF